MKVRLLLTLRVRLWCGLVALFSLIVGWGMATQPELFVAPVFHLLLNMMPLVAWQWLWWTVAALMVAAIATRRAVVWRCGCSSHWRKASP